MQDPVLFYAIMGAVAAAVGGRWLFRKHRFRQAVRTPLAEDKLALVRKRIPFYDFMPEALQADLQDKIKRFLFAKEFVGCAGLVVTEDMKITVAASASLLLLNRPTSLFRRVRWIYLYPAEFVVRHSVTDAAGVVSQSRGILSGEAWGNGRVILSWSDVEQGVFDFNDGRNVVLHEFAHQLDAESGSMNGAPLLYSKGAYGTWAAILSREYDALRTHTYFGRRDVLDSYGATNPAEFFAVATESFFEQPETLNDEHPELFEQLQSYFHVDPREWRKKPSSATTKKDSKAEHAVNGGDDKALGETVDQTGKTAPPTPQPLSK